MTLPDVSSRTSGYLQASELQSETYSALCAPCAHMATHTHVMRHKNLHLPNVRCSKSHLQAAREGKTDSEREALHAQMMVLHLRSRIQKELGMQVQHPECHYLGKSRLAHGRFGVVSNCSSASQHHMLQREHCSLQISASIQCVWSLRCRRKPSGAGAVSMALLLADTWLEGGATRTLNI